MPEGKGETSRLENASDKTPVYNEQNHSTNITYKLLFVRLWMVHIDFLVLFFLLCETMKENQPMSPGNCFSFFTNVTPSLQWVIYIYISLPLGYDLAPQTVLPQKNLYKWEILFQLVPQLSGDSLRGWILVLLGNCRTTAKGGARVTW